MIFARECARQLCKAFTCCTHEVHAYVVYYWGRCSQPVGEYGGQCMGMMQRCEGEDGRVMSALMRLVGACMMGMLLVHAGMW